MILNKSTAIRIQKALRVLLRYPGNCRRSISDLEGQLKSQVIYQPDLPQDFFTNLSIISPLNDCSPNPVLKFIRTSP